MYSEVLEDKGTMRVSVVLEEGPAEPENESPLLRQDSCRHDECHRVEHVGWSDGYPCSYRVEAAARKWGVDSPLFEKYLRAFHGVTKMTFYRNSDYVYVTFDDKSWRDSVGAPEGSGNLDDYEAWCEGDVYGYVIERKETWHAESDPEITMTTWEEDEASWGIYGYEYAVEAAKEAFAL